MGWLIFFLIISFLLITVLFAPIRLFVDTKNNRYFISWGNVVYGQVIILTDDLKLHINVLGFKKSWTVLELIAGSKKADKKPKRKKSDKKGSKAKFPKDLIFPILRSFKIKQLNLQIDFQSVYWNSWLYPVGYLVSKENIYCSTNFEGRNELTLEIVNRPFWLLRNVIQSKLNLNSKQ